MSYNVKLEQYEGPLAALLELIESEKLDISEVSLAHVTDGFLKLLDENPEMPVEELADFLVVASRLLWIKSKILLPYLNLGGETDDGPDLESQLRIYKAYLDASKVIESIIGKRRFLYVHDKLPKVEIGFSPPEKFGTAQMREMFLAVIARLEPVVKPQRQVLERTVSIHEKIQQIRAMMSRAKRVSFGTLVQTASSRLEIIVSFLALLELVKQRAVSVSQGEKFTEISIARTEECEVS